MPDGITITFEADTAKIDAYLDGLRSKPIKVPIVLEPADKGSAPAESSLFPGAADALNAAKAAFSSGITPVESGIKTSTFSAIPAGNLGSIYSVPEWMMQSLSSASRPTIPPQQQQQGESTEPDVLPEKPMFAQSPQVQKGITAAMASIQPQKPIFSLHDLYETAHLLPNASPAGSPAPAVGPLVSALLARPHQAQQASPQGQQATERQAQTNQTNQQTSSQFANAVQQFVTAVQQYARPGGQINPAAHADHMLTTGNRIGGLSTYGLARYVGLGFMAREALNIAQSGGDYEFAQRVSNNQPGAMLQNNLSLYDRVAGVPVVGQLAGQFVDPLGQRRNQIAYDVEAAQGSEAFRFSRISLGIQANYSKGRADVAALLGFQQSQKEAEIQRDMAVQKLKEFQASPEEQAKIQSEVDKRTVELNQYYDERKVRLQKELYQREFDKPGVEGRLFRQMTDQARMEKIRPAFESGVADIESQRQIQIGKESAEIRINAQSPIQAQIDAANRELVNRTRILEYEQQQQIIGFNFQASQLRYQMIPGGQTRAGYRENELGRIEVETAAIRKRSTDPTVADAFRESELARLDFSDFQFNRQIQRELFGITARTQQVGIVGGTMTSPLASPFGAIQTPSTRRLEAQVLDIVNQTESQRRSLIEQYGGTEAERRGLLHANALEGRTRLLALRNQMNESQEGMEINPFIQSTTGLRTFNQGVIQQELKQALQQVGNESRYLPTDNAGSGGGLNSSAAGQSISMIQQQSLQGVQLMQQIWNFLQQLQLQIA